MNSQQAVFPDRQPTPHSLIQIVTLPYLQISGQGRFPDHSTGQFARTELVIQYYPVF
jgi:hypothetical protein